MKNTLYGVFSYRLNALQFLKYWILILIMLSRKRNPQKKSASNKDADFTFITDRLLSRLTVVVAFSFFSELWTAVTLPS